MILVIVILFLIHSFIKAYRLVYKGSHPRKSKVMDLKYIPYKCRKFYFKSKDNLKISAIEYIPNQKPKGTIIACHYLGGSKISIYPYIESLLNANFTVVSFDYINHGESESRKGNKYTLENDIKRFIDKLKQLDIKGPYGTMGFSMGATLAICAKEITPEIAAVVVDSGPLIYVKEYFEHVLKTNKVRNPIIKLIFYFYYLYVIGFYRMSRKMKKRLKNMGDIPILMIHSKKDRVISYRNAEYVFNLLKSKNAKLISVPRAHHLTNRVILGKVYDEYIVEFFEKWLVNHEETKNNQDCIK